MYILDFNFKQVYYRTDVGQVNSPYMVVVTLLQGFTGFFALKMKNGVNKSRYTNEDAVFT